MSTDSATPPAASGEPDAVKAAELQAEAVASEPIQSFEVPRPTLTLAQAASVLGKSMRSLERSLTGRWGNKLPEGWTAKKVRAEKGDEWRITPPPGFRLRQTNSPDNMSRMAEVFAEPPGTERMLAAPRRTPWRAENHSLDHPAIVIDRSEEVEHLLRELLVVQKALSEERRVHMEDMRLMAQIQGSMRLLETSASESARVKTELENTKKELEELKREYNYVVNLPWWKRLFGAFTK